MDQENYIDSDKKFSQYSNSSSNSKHGSTSKTERKNVKSASPSTPKQPPDTRSTDSFQDHYHFMSKMIHDVRLFQVALAELVQVLADTSTARQECLVTQHLRAMLKPTRAVIQNYDLAPNLQTSVITGTTHVIGLVKTYNASWNELELKNKKLKEYGPEKFLNSKEALSLNFSTDSSHSNNSNSSTRDVVIDSAVASAISSGLNENCEFDLTSTPLHEQLFTAIDELALTFSNAVHSHLQSLQPSSICHSNKKDNLDKYDDDFDSNTNDCNTDSNSNLQSPVIHKTDSSPKAQSKNVKNRLSATNSNNSNSSLRNSANQKANISHHVLLSRQPAVRHKAYSFDTNQNNVLEKTPSNPENKTVYTSKSPPLQLQGLDSTEAHSIDKIISKNKNGVEKALDHLKQVVKYSNVLLHYVETKTKCLTDYGKSINRMIAKIDFCSDSGIDGVEEHGGKGGLNNGYLEVDYSKFSQMEWLKRKIGDIRVKLRSKECVMQPPLFALLEQLTFQDQAFSIKCQKLREDSNVQIINPLLTIKQETEKNINILTKYWSNERHVYTLALKKYEKSKKTYQYRLNERSQFNNSMETLESNNSNNVENLDNKVESALEQLKHATDILSKTCKRYKASQTKVLGAIRECSKRYEKAIKFTIARFAQLQQRLFYTSHVYNGIYDLAVEHVEGEGYVNWAREYFDSGEPQQPQTQNLTSPNFNNYTSYTTQTQPTITPTKYNNQKDFPKYSKNQIDSSQDHKSNHSSHTSIQGSRKIVSSDSHNVRTSFNSNNSHSTTVPNSFSTDNITNISGSDAMSKKNNQRSYHGNVEYSTHNLGNFSSQQVLNNNSIHLENMASYNKIYNSNSQLSDSTQPKSIRPTSSTNQNIISDANNTPLLSVSNTSNKANNNSLTNVDNISSESRSLDGIYVPKHIDSSTDQLDVSSTDAVVDNQVTNLDNKSTVVTSPSSSKDLSRPSNLNNSSRPVNTTVSNSQSSSGSLAVGYTLRKAAKVLVFGRFKGQKNKQSSHSQHSGDNISGNITSIPEDGIENETPKGLFSTSLDNLFPPIPTIIQLCVEDVEARGISLKGIYRVNGVKTRVDSLAEEFERLEDESQLTNTEINVIDSINNSPNIDSKKSSIENLTGNENGQNLNNSGVPNGSSSSVLSSPKNIDLSMYTPHDVSSVLKRFLQQLPEPLFSFEFYEDFMKISRKFEKDKDDIAALHNCCDLIKLLSESHKCCLDYLLKHLNLVANNYEENKMTSSNLGVVFGPTLFRMENSRLQKDFNDGNFNILEKNSKSKYKFGKNKKQHVLTASAILDEIKDMPDQARLIELLITQQDFVSSVLSSESQQYYPLTRV